jgi:hypothetical protein
MIAYRKELGGAMVCLSSATLLDSLFSKPTVGISGDVFLLLSKWKKKTLKKSSIICKNGKGTTKTKSDRWVHMVYSLHQEEGNRECFKPKLF